MAIDFLIITPLSEERDAVLSKFPDAKKQPPSEHDIRVYYKASVPVQFSDNSCCNYTVIITDLIGMGRVEAANCANDAIRRWQPRYVLLVGIAGGISEAGVQLGDALIAEQIADYEVQKLTVDGSSIRWQVHRTDPRLLVAARQLKTTDWQPFVSQKRPEVGDVNQHFGPVCTGDKVVANGLIDQYRDVWVKLVGVEMEAGGVASTLFQSASAPGFFMIRGVSDLADANKETPKVKAWRAYACDVAAAFTVALIRSGPIPPHKESVQPSVTNQPTIISTPIDLRSQALDELEAISFAKCIERWQAAGVSKAQAIQLARNSTTGEPSLQMRPTSAKPLLLLTGEIGSGKTLLAHRLLQIAIQRARIDPKSPWPIFLDARDAVGKLTEILERRVNNLAFLGEAGAFVVIDGADEAGFTAIDQLLSEARTITALQRPQIFIVITCRPIGNLHEKAKGELIEVPPLSEDVAWALIGFISGNTFNLGMTLSWPHSLREAVRRPLFAILFGGFLRAHYAKSSFSLGEVLAHLVERAIENTQLNRPNVEHLLEKLAKLSTERQGGAVPIREVGTRRELEPLLESRLIVERGGMVFFPLAILREWFGAQVLVADATTFQQILNTPILVDAWRNSFVIAVANFDYDRVAKILAPLVEKHPGIASSIVDEALASWGVHDESFAPPVLECGRRIRDTMLSWTIGIGRLASLIAPIRENGSIRPLGVNLNGAGLTACWYQGDKEIPDVVELSAEMLAHRSISNGWPGHRWARPTRQSGWAWKWTLEELTNRVSRLIQDRRLPISGGPIVYEQLWPQLVALSRRRLTIQERRYTPLKAEISIAEIETELADSSMKGRWHFTSGWCDVDFVREQVAFARSCGVEFFCPPWPESDRPYRRGIVGSEYSNEHLLRRCSTVYEQTLIAYRQIVEDWFPSLAPRLETYVLLPVRVVGHLSPFADCMNETTPWLSWFLEPLPDGATSEIDIKIGHKEIFRPREQFFREQKAILAARRLGAENWINPTFHSDKPEIFDASPITKLTYEWLWSDLKKIGWGK